MTDDDLPNVWQPWTPQQRRAAQIQRRDWLALKRAMLDDELNIEMGDPRRVMPTFELNRRSDQCETGSNTD